MTVRHWRHRVVTSAFHAVTAAKQAHKVRIREAQLAESQTQAQALRRILRREVDLLAGPTDQPSPSVPV